MGDKEFKKGGNSLLFGLYLIGNVVLIIFGLLMMSLGIYSCEKNKNFAEYNGSFLIIGTLIVVAGLIGHVVRYSPLHLFVYEVSLTLLFVLQIIFVIVSFEESHLDTSEESQALFQFAIVETIFIIIFCFVFAGCYWRSLENVNKAPAVKVLQSHTSPFIKH